MRPMNMDTFWCITLSIIILRVWWKHHRPIKKSTKPSFQPNNGTELARKAQAQQERARNEAELRKQGYTDELIATILPVIENDN